MSSSRTFEENRSTAEEALARYSLNPLLHLIDGELVPSASGDTFDNFSPVDGRLLGKVAAGEAGEIGLASEAAAAAFEEWSSQSPIQRKQVLNRVAELIVKRADEIAAVESADTGQPIRFMSSAAIRGAENFRYLLMLRQGLLMASQCPLQLT